MAFFLAQFGFFSPSNNNQNWNKTQKNIEITDKIKHSGDPNNGLVKMSPNGDLITRLNCQVIKWSSLVVQCRIKV